MEHIKALVEQLEAGELGSKEAEAAVHHCAAAIVELRALQARAHAALEARLLVDRSRELKQRPAGFPPNQSIGAQ